MNFLKIVCSFLIVMISAVFLTSCAEVSNGTNKKLSSLVKVIKLPPLSVTIPQGWQTPHSEEETGEHKNSTRVSEKGMGERKESTLDSEKGTGEHKESTLDSEKGTGEHKESTLDSEEETEERKEGTDKNIVLVTQDQRARALIVSQKIVSRADANPEELLKAYGRIGIKTYLKEGVSETDYLDSITIAAQPAVQYILDTGDGAVAVSFVQYSNILFVVKVEAPTEEIFQVNEVILHSISFDNNQNVLPETLKEIEYKISQHISGLHLGNLRSIKLNFRKEILNDADISGKVEILEQICFVTAFLRTEALDKEQDQTHLHAIINDVHRLFKKNPEIISLARCHALAVYLENKFAESFDLLSKIIQNHPEDLYAKLYLAMIRPYAVDDSHGKIEAMLENDPGNVLGLYLKSKSLLAQGKERAGKDLLKKVVRKHPDNIWLNYVMARNATDKKTIDRAEKRYVKILDEDASFVGARFNLALLYYQNEKYSEALQQLDTILTLYPDDAASYLLKGLIFKNKDENQSAKQQFELALSAEPDNFKALYNLGALCAAKLNDPHCARLAFTRYIHVAPQNNRYASIVNWLRENE